MLLFLATTAHGVTHAVKSHCTLGESAWGSPACLWLKPTSTWPDPLGMSSTTTTYDGKTAELHTISGTPWEASRLAGYAKVLDWLYARGTIELTAHDTMAPTKSLIWIKDPELEKIYSMDEASGGERGEFVSATQLPGDQWDVGNGTFFLSLSGTGATLDSVVGEDIDADGDVDYLMHLSNGEVWEVDVALPPGELVVAPQ